MNNDNVTQTDLTQDQDNPWQQDTTEPTGTTEVQDTSSPVTSGDKSTTDDVTTPPAAPAPVALDADSLRLLVRETAEAVRPPQQPPKMSMEEFNRVMNVYQVTPEVAQRLGLTPEVAPVLNEILQAIARQAVTMSEYRIGDQLGVLRKHYDEQLTPLQQYYAEQQENAYRAEFLARNKDLVGWEPLLEATYAQLKAEGKRFETKDQAYKEIADRARAVIKKLPAAGATNAQQTATATATQRRQMSTLTGGGQGGTGGGKGAAVSTAKSIFG